MMILLIQGHFREFVKPTLAADTAENFLYSYVMLHQKPKASSAEVLALAHMSFISY